MFNILVCDDDKEIVDAIDIYLSQEGYHILKAYDGLQAIEIMKKEEVHLILLDIMMPNLDGIRATRKIRETSSVPIIMLSAKSEDVDKILGLNIGADDYITKPFNPLELIARVKSQLRSQLKEKEAPDLEQTEKELKEQKEQQRLKERELRKLYSRRETNQQANRRLQQLTKEREELRKRYPAGTLRDRSGKLWGRDPDHYGTKYRYLRDGTVIKYRSN